LRGDRRFWAGFLFVNWIGPISYFVYGRRKSLLGCGAEELNAVGDNELGIV
jgi:hypothetical protein